MYFGKQWRPRWNAAYDAAFHQGLHGLLLDKNNLQALKYILNCKPLKNQEMPHRPSQDFSVTEK